LRSTQGTGRWAYAASKRAVELALDEASSRSSWPVAPLHLRLFNVVGPDQDAHSGMVLPTFVRCALMGEALPVHGSGDQVRTLGHVQDVAKDIVQLALGRELPVGALNLGGIFAAPCSSLPPAWLRSRAGTCPACSTWIRP